MSQSFQISGFAKKLGLSVDKLAEDLAKVNIKVDETGNIAEKDKLAFGKFMRSKQGPIKLTTRRKQHIRQSGQDVSVQITSSQSYIQKPISVVQSPQTRATDAKVSLKDISDHDRAIVTSDQAKKDISANRTDGISNRIDQHEAIDPLSIGSTIAVDTVEEEVSQNSSPVILTDIVQTRLNEVRPIEPIRKASAEESRYITESRTKRFREKAKAEAIDHEDAKPIKKKQTFNEKDIDVKTLKGVNLSALKEDLDEDSTSPSSQPGNQPVGVVAIKSKHAFQRPINKKLSDIEIPAEISLKDLAKKMAMKPKALLKKIDDLGVDVEESSLLDFETAYLITEECGFKAEEQQLSTPESELQEYLDSCKRGIPKPRPPVITIMGHVDHGKTSLLDYIRRSKVADGEAGGITQHLSAYDVSLKQGKITFVDTPGHAAFTSMRSRGAKFTDIVVLIVAADDGVMPQTIEIIQHVKASKVPMIVAINKMDRAEANEDNVLQGLSQNDVLTERWGGQIPVVNISAKTGLGVNELLETVLLQAEIMELTAPTQGPAKGYVLECRKEHGLGVVTSLIVEQGELKQGDIMVSGRQFGKVRALISSDHKRLKKVPPSIPVDVTGFAELPEVGDSFVIVDNERFARTLCDFRSLQQKEQEKPQGMTLESLFLDQAGADIKQVNLVLKADTRGSAEALRDSLTKLSTSEVEVNFVATGVGGISESDAVLAMAQNAIIIGFNVRADGKAKQIIEREKIALNYYSVIYEVVEDVEKALLGQLQSEFRESIIGIAQVREVFRAKRVGAVAGCMVTEGEIKRHAPIRVLRDDVVIYEGELESLKRFKEDVSSVRNNTECGIGVKNYTDVRIGDLIEVFEKIEIKPTLVR